MKTNHLEHAEADPFTILRQRLEALAQQVEESEYQAVEKLINSKDVTIVARIEGWLTDLGNAVRLKKLPLDEHLEIIVDRSNQDLKSLGVIG